MLSSERQGLAVFCTFVAVGVGGLFLIVSEVCNDADAERARAWARYEQRLGLCEDVLGRDFQGCMDRAQAHQDMLERRRTDVEEKS